MERDSAGQERNGVLRLLSLELTFADARCAELLSDARFLAAMARFEGALARASANTGIVPQGDAQTIARVCEQAKFDAAQLARSARHAGTLAIPFVRNLTEQVASVSKDAARYVHFGATSQDVIDTASVLCLREAGDRVSTLSTQLGDALGALVERYAHAPLAARTLLQPALPVPFGWKAATWLSMLSRAHAHFRTCTAEMSLLQFGGAAGTLSAFGTQGMTIALALAGHLDLRMPAISWHSARDGFARFGSAAAILTGAAGRVARDVSLLMQPEIGEAAEPASPGRGGSSSLPHKRNPAGCLLALEASQRVPGLVATLLAQLTPEHERGLGQWQAQWFTLRELLGAAASALAAMADVAGGLQINTDAMLANMERSHGLLYSEAISVRLAVELGKSAAHALVEKLCVQASREGKSLLAAMRADTQIRQLITEREMVQLFRPENAYGSAAAMMERVRGEWQAARTAGAAT